MNNEQGSKKSKTKKIGGEKVKGNPFGITTGGTSAGIGQSMLRGKAGVKVTSDKRKSVRMPIELYGQVMKERSYGERSELFGEIIKEFSTAYQKKGDAILKEYGKTALETRPVKISNDIFKMLKVLNFETDYSFVDIIASALDYYLKH